jgi:replication factor C subunit 2/4
MTSPLLNTPWIEKYRPSKLSQIVGNKRIISNLQSISESGNLPNLILAGPPGTGKTTSVLALAHELLGENFKKAVIELNASDERGINVVRDKIKRFAQQKIPLPEGRHKIIILDEADSMTSSAQGSMRVTISDYSNTTRFVLACNDSSKIIEAIQSRCTVLRFGKLSSDDIKERIKFVLNNENAKYDEKGLQAIIDTCNGDMRYALNNSQSCIVGFGEINEENVYKIVELPRPKEIEKIYNFCLNKMFVDAINKFSELFNDGYSCLEIISVFNRLIQENDKIDDKVRITLLKKISEYKMNLIDGLDSDLQMSGFISEIYDIIQKGK